MAGLRRLTPATLMRQSTRPNISRTLVVSCLIWSASATSQAMPMGGNMAPALSLAAASFAPSAVRPVTMTMALRWAKPWAMAKPMPRVPPETRTIWLATEKRSGMVWALGVWGERLVMVFVLEADTTSLRAQVGLGVSRGGWWKLLVDGEFGCQRAGASAQVERFLS